MLGVQLEQPLDRRVVLERDLVERVALLDRVRAPGRSGGRGRRGRARPSVRAARDRRDVLVGGLGLGVETGPDQQHRDGRGREEGSRREQTSTPERAAAAARRHRLPARGRPDLALQPRGLRACGGAPVGTRVAGRVHDGARHGHERARGPARERTGDVGGRRALRADARQEQDRARQQSGAPPPPPADAWRRRRRRRSRGRARRRGPRPTRRRGGPRAARAAARRGA